MDLTTEWFALVRSLRRQSSTATATAAAAATAAAEAAAEASGAHRVRSDGAAVLASAAEAAVSGSRWRAPLTPFMQQATELNYNIREMHAFLTHHFLDYVDLHHCLPSKRSLMTADEKDLIDLEVTSFMTACAAGVDALKALLQRERLRRMEQEAAAARAVGEDGQGLDDIGGGGSLGGGGGGELLPGSRPAHEHAAVTFLFERLKAVTEVAETMQTERHQRAAASKARFYAGPAESRRDATEEKPSSATAGGGDVWTRTPEELEEERLLQLSFPAAYGNSQEAEAGGARDNNDEDTGDGYYIGAAERKGAETAAATTDPSSQGIFSSNSSSITAAAAVVVGASSSPPAAAAGGTSVAGMAVTSSCSDASTAGKESVAAADAMGEGRRRRRKYAGQQKPGGVLAGAANAVRRWGRGEAAVGEEMGGEGGGSPVVSAAVLEGENRDLVARLKNELDDARLVETKMSEISGLMGLFASKVVEQQGGMEHVFDVAVSANDKVVRGGQNLEKAAERGGAFRLFYAYFMISASFCLLFLHFYRP